jgi:acyl-CoA dehydrogenase
MMALAEPDLKKGLDRFDKVFWRHVGHSLITVMRAFGRSWTGGRLAPAPDIGATARFYRQLSRYAASFAMVSDMALLTLGGRLKRKEMLAARLGDVLSELYLLSAALKRWEDEGRQDADLPLLAWCMETGFNTIEMRFADVFANLPNRFVACILRFINQPFGAGHRSPADALTKHCAQLLLEPSETRDRLTAGLYLGKHEEGLARLERAFALAIENEPIAKRLRDARIYDWRAAKKSGLITDIESERMAALEEAVAKVVAVDDFAADALSPTSKKPTLDNATLASRSTGAS